MTTTLMEYSRELVPMIRKQIELSEALKEWKAEDQLVQEYLQEIKDIQDALKAHVEDKEGKLVSEIADLNRDITLAVKGAARGTNYKAAELKTFFTARAKESVEKVVSKGELFQQLESELA